MSGKAWYVSLACACLCAHSASAGDGPETVVELPFEARGKSLVRTDLERCTPQHVIRSRAEDGAGMVWLSSGPERDRDAGHWVLRRPSWTASLLNAVGTPADLSYDPELTGAYDIYLGLRAVDPHMSLAVKLSGEDEFDTITAPAASATKHFDFEFHWRIAADLTGRKIVLRSIGRPVYVQHLRFVPCLTGTRKHRTTTDHVTISKTAGRHHAFPGLARLPSGDLGVVFRDGVAHVCPFGRIMFTRSADNGRTWSEPICIQDTPSDERDPALIALPDGRLAVTFNTWNSWLAQGDLRRKYAAQTARIEKDGLRAYTGPKIMFSSDDGRTWSEPKRIPCFTPHGFAVAPGAQLYYPACRSTGDRRTIVIWRSDDAGLTWAHHADAGTSAGASEAGQTEGFAEPHLAILRDGTFLASVRVQADGYVQLVSSQDSGRRWSRPRKVPVKGFPQHLLPLRDGRVLMAYGYRYKPFGIRACVSQDRGETWDMANEVLLRHDGAGFDLGYPVSLELEDGRVLTVYYHVQEDGLCYIEAAFYRP